VTETISIDELWTGEVVVSAEAVAAERAHLEGGGTIEPVSVIRIGNRLIVRDGNNRVRAWIEYHLATSETIPWIPFLPSDKPMSDDAAPELEMTAKYHGQGVAGFEKLETVPKADYERRSNEASKRIRDAVRSQGDCLPR
jgi:hypothetical protein